MKCSWHINRDPDNFILENGDPQTTYEGSALQALTDEDVARLYEIIDQAKPVVQGDRSVFEILTNEALYFLKGRASAQEAASRIQERVQLYLDEQK